MFSCDEKKPPKIVGVQYVGEPTYCKQVQTIGVSEDSDKQLKDDEDKYRKKSVKLPTWHSLVVLTFISLIFLVVKYLDRRLPQPLTLEDVDEFPLRFIEERARNYLKKLTSVGPRPAGSYENEVLAAAYVRRSLVSIQQRAKPMHKLTIDVQKPRGSFNLKFGDGFTHNYRNIQNIIAKLESDLGSNNALLVNCHFDSVPQSPGASDDAVSCAIMLEILEVLTQTDQPLKNNVIFLFNGAEENILPASHGFITQHVWAQEIRAFINLEACGSGGRELLFQSGPDNPWLISAYVEAAPHPFASVICQEIFHFGVIPSDTDFRIFRDYGNIPGLDIAYLKNGYVYHTKFDTEELIPSGSVQRAGDNVLAVVKHLANSQALAHPEEYLQGSVVYFDLFGLFMIHYSEWVGIVLNITVSILSIYLTFRKFATSYQFGISSNVYLWQLCYTFFIQVCGFVASFVSVALVAVILDAMSRTMSWYSKPYLIFFLYVSPSLMAFIAVYSFALARQKKCFRFMDGVWVIESLYFEVTKLIWTFWTVVLTLLRFKSSFFFMFWVLFPMVGRYALEVVYDRCVTKRRKKDWIWFLAHLCSLIVPISFTTYCVIVTMYAVVPMMGVTGSTVNPDLIIAFVSAFLTTACFSYLYPLVMVMNKPNIIISTLYVTNLITVILVLTTKLGFPYSASPSNLAPQRILIFHTQREFFDKLGKSIKNDSGYHVVNLDRNSPNVLLDSVPEMLGISEITDKQCDRYLFCGFPVYFPLTNMLKTNHWTRAKKPRIYQETALNLIHRESPSPDIVKLLFQIKGPNHIGVHFSPDVGVHLKTWSFADGQIMNGPMWKDNRPTYYIFCSHGINPDSWQFWLEFKVPRGYLPEQHNLVDMGVSGHIIHGSGMKSPEFKNFLHQFPAWSYPVGWTVSFKYYNF